MAVEVLCSCFSSYFVIISEITFPSNEEFKEFYSCILCWNYYLITTN